jgi:3'(2'), 5'-bisphosphate nucleotidase
MAALDHHTLLRGLLPAVMTAAQAIMRHRAQGLLVERKADGSPVSAADREAESIILAGLAEVAPGVLVIAEEAIGSSAVSAPLPASRFFLVDPLDGTKSYIAGLDDFTINIGLVENGAPVFGIVYAPALGRLFATADASTAIEARVELSLSSADLQQLESRRIRTRPPGSGNMQAVASRSHPSPGMERLLRDLGVSHVRRLGSSLKFCLVASGEADLYPRLGETSAWDTAAGHAVLLAAGGVVTTLDGDVLTYGTRGSDWNNPPFMAWAHSSLVRRL